MKAGEPADKEGYSKVEQDGLIFYIKDELAGKQLLIDYQGWLLFKKLTVMEK